jgi:hypothetical protein
MDQAEWKYLRRIHRIRDGLSNPDDKVIHTQKESGVYEVYLGSCEEVAIPFVFQSFLHGQVGRQTKNYKRFPGSKENVECDGDSIRPRVIHVLHALSNTHR